jgi:hypothetical protein
MSAARHGTGDMFIERISQARSYIAPVCTENLSPDVLVVKSAKDGV